jgi:hypothetical protein
VCEVIPERVPVIEHAPDGTLVAPVGTEPPGWSTAPPPQAGGTEPTDDRGADRRRIALGLLVGAGGRIHVDNGLFGAPGGSYDTSPSPGLSLTIDRVFGSLFSFGGGARIFGYKPEGASDRTAIDLFLAPHFRFNVNILDIYFGPTVGFSIDKPPGDDAEKGFGVNLTFVGGLQLYAGRHIAFFAEGGVLARRTRYGELFDAQGIGLVQGLFTIGITFVI